MKDICAYFGLKLFPFDKDLKINRAFNSESLTESLARLDFMKRRDGIMLLTGDPGVGKTLALRRFTDGLNENLYKIIYTPLSTLTRIDLLRHINDKLGRPNRATKSAVYTQIQKELLESKEQRGKTVLLIIDEAHLLQTGPLQELRLLTNFKMDSYDPFILILSGQSELLRVMDYAVMEPMAQRIAMKYHFAPLSKEETPHYIKHHLLLAGTKKPLFSPDALSAVFEVTYGIPRKIGAVAIQSLTYAMFEGKHSVDANTVLKVKTAA